MSQKKTDKKEFTIKESIENLQGQLKEFSEKAEHFKTMKLKTEGAIEVLMQLDNSKEEK